jgi:tetratricopeptide (TPR) repeat protein
MAHLTKEEILRACEGGWAEVEAIASHLAVCPACRARAAGLIGDGAAAEKRAPLLKSLAELATFEKAQATDRLLAKAEMAELRRLPRGAQKKRVILSRSCHSPAFLDALLDALRSTLRSRDESESFANLAVLAAQGIDPAEGSEAYKNDLLAMTWIETANARRIRGEWQHARSALLRAEEHRALGTGDPIIQARWLSIAGSLQCDQGRRAEAMASLEECRKAYSLCGDWPLVGRTLVQMAHCIADDERERALDLLDRASIYISSEDTSLRSLAERIRTDCLITLGRVEDGLHAFREAERLRPPNDGPRAGLRATFLAARLLESLGHGEEAEALFDAVVLDELDQGRFNDVVLDLVYIFGFHLRRGSPERAADLGVRAIAELDRRAAAANEECRSVLVQLIDAAQGQSLDEGMLRAAREYLRLQWNRSSPAEPKPTSAGERVLAPPTRPAITPEPMLVEPLLARAHLSRLRRETRREQHARVARSAEYHTAAFVELLLTGVREASSRDEAEFTANLALQAITPMEAPALLKHDLEAQVWTEVANARRIASEWTKASAALIQAMNHLAHGTGNPLLKARAQSISASLLADQGRRVEALAALEECIELYEGRGAWPLVARTMVQMAHTLASTDPAQALILAERAFPMMSAADTSLRCLAENIRTDCMIDLGEIELALQTFDAAERFRRGASPIARRRSDFLAARLLEYLGHYKEAVQLFEAVIAESFDREVYREAFLDLLYLFGVHLRQGATEKAVALCRLAIERLDLFGLGHEQLRTVWMQLGEAAMRRAIRLESLAEVREFLKAHWKTPAARVPRFTSE